MFRFEDSRPQLSCGIQKRLRCDGSIDRPEFGPQPCFADLIIDTGVHGLDGESDERNDGMQREPFVGIQLEGCPPFSFTFRFPLLSFHLTVIFTPVLYFVCVSRLFLFIYLTRLAIRNLQLLYMCLSTYQLWLTDAERDEINQ
jgi:hypothetical protein